MKKKVILFTLIPLILVVVILIGGFVFLKQKSKPQAIFKTFVSKAFEAAEKEKVTSLKGSVELFASYEPDNSANAGDAEYVERIKKMLDTSKVKLDTAVDINNLLLDENILVTYENETLINAELLVQDEKLYVALKDWLNKYLQITEDSFDFDELKREYNKINTLDRAQLLSAIKQELVNVLDKQQYLQEKTTLKVNGQDVEVTKSTLSLNQDALEKIYADLLGNLKANSKFQAALGEYKDEVIEYINEELEYSSYDSNTNNAYNQINLNEAVADEFSSYNEYNNSSDYTYLTEFIYTFSFYTKGMQNEFVAAEVDLKSEDKSLQGFSVVKQGENKYEYSIYEFQDGVKTDIAKVIIDNSNMSASGNTYTGNTKITSIITDVGAIDINCTYNIELNANIEKKDVSNAVLIDEMSSEDKEEFMKNFEKSKLYNMFSGLFNLFGGNFSTNNNSNVSNEKYTVSFEQVVESDELMVWENSRSKVLYVTGDNNYIQASLEGNADEFLNNINLNNVLSTTDSPSNPIASEINEYPINGLEFKYKTVVYEGLNSSVMLYFVCPIDAENSYVVEVETSGNISLDEVNKFLDINILSSGSGQNTLIQNLTEKF